jgi:hypothetical protein
LSTHILVVDDEPDVACSSGISGVIFVRAAHHGVRAVRSGCMERVKMIADASLILDP